jgi:lipopolysaccharide biosynthesis glycosyltransferase
VVATNLPEEDRRKIEVSLGRNRDDFEPGSLHWLSPSLEMVEGLHLSAHVTIDTYARLLAPRVLPEDVDKVLYLDCDMVVLSDLSPLYDSSCEGSAVHAARDEVGTVSGPRGVFNFSDLGIPPETPYFNSGVLLMNLRRWREQAIAERVLEYLRRYRASVRFWDQGGMNAILHDAWTEIDPAWNQMQCVFRPERWRELGRSMADWKRTLYHPKIVHYTGLEKPWRARPLPGYSYFFNYLERTSYRDAFKGPRLERMIGFRLNYFLWRVKNFLVRQRGRVTGKLHRVFKPPVSANTGSLNKD